MRSTTDKAGALRIVVLGHIVRGPVGGMAWHHLQYVQGLARLGHDVWFFEDSQDYPACYDPSRGVTDTDPGYGLGFAARAFEKIGLADRWVYFDAHTGRWCGPVGRPAKVCAGADVVLNMSGKNPLRPWHRDIPQRVLVDTDPVFTQIRHLEDPAAMERAREHTAFLTFGENIPRGVAAVPDDGLPWRATRQPIVLDAWPVRPAPERGPLSTVMLWDSYRPSVHRGVSYGMKSQAFAPFLDLPGRAGARFTLAAGSPSLPKAQLRDAGWQLVDPLDATRTLESYQEFIQGSRGEFSVAKHGYVAGGCGWFSERSAAYMASGRPVVVQDTGFTDWLPTGAGVLPFTDPDTAVAQLDELDRGYARHAEAARALAVSFFASDTVLEQLLADVFAARREAVR